MAEEATPGAPWFVAMDGRDGWSGRLAEPNPAGTDGPFATLKRARDEIRVQSLSPANGDAAADRTVLVRRGVHFLDEPLTFGPEDSGTVDGPIAYAAYPGKR